MFFQLLEIQQAYHKKALDELDKTIPKMRDTLGMLKLQ